MDLDKQESVVRSVLKNEFTWIVMIVGFVVTFFTQVVIPISTIQIQLVSIQNDISNLKSYDSRITQNSNDIIVLKQQINQLTKQ